MFGRMYSEFWGKVSAMIIFIGFNMTFFPQFILGFTGMPRRYASYPPEFQVLNIFSTPGASILAVGVIITAVNLGYSLFNGKIVGDNPWLLPGLEWRTTSPPPTETLKLRRPLPGKPTIKASRTDCRKRLMNVFPGGSCTALVVRVSDNFSAIKHR